MGGRVECNEKRRGRERGGLFIEEDLLFRGHFERVLSHVELEQRQHVLCLRLGGQARHS